jgi:hypothetical protein
VWGVPSNNPLHVPRMRFRPRHVAKTDVHYMIFEIPLETSSKTHTFTSNTQPREMHARCAPRERSANIRAGLTKSMQHVSSDMVEEDRTRLL